MTPEPDPALLKLGQLAAKIPMTVDECRRLIELRQSWKNATTPSRPSIQNQAASIIADCHLRLQTRVKQSLLDGLTVVRCQAEVCLAAGIFDGAQYARQQELIETAETAVAENRFEDVKKIADDGQAAFNHALHRLSSN